MARLMFYVLFATVLMTLDSRGGYVQQARATAGLAVEPILLAVETPFTLALHLRDNFADRRTLLAERDELERLLRESRARLLLKEELALENAELRELLEASRAIDTDYLTAELRNIDLNPYAHRVLINRGSAHGLVAGRPVMDASGVVGQVDQVLTYSATVILLSDPDHALPVRVDRNRLRTIAYGSGRMGELALTDLPMNVDLVPGDLLMTSGLGGRFPAGLPVAEVIDIQRPAGEAFARATARPLASLDGARHLLILRLEEPPAPAGPPAEQVDSMSDDPPVVETIEASDVDEPAPPPVDPDESP